MVGTPVFKEHVEKEELVKETRKEQSEENKENRLTMDGVLVAKWLESVSRCE